jgi:hypothetical protein
MLTRAAVRCLACAALTLLAPAVATAQPPAQPAVTAEPPKAALTALTVYPPQIALDGPRDEQRLGVLGHYADGRSWDLSRDARYTSSAPKVAAVSPHGLVQPVGDGQAVITVEAGGKKASVPVQVKKATADIPVSFAREVMPVLTRMGCNQGACHGSQHGRGGFKLSLLGFDPSFDYAQIVASAEGRRVVVSDPERSILLQKPTLTMEHGGGERFKVNSRAYNLLKRWLEDGVPEPNAKDPEVTGLEVWPARRTLVPGEKQQILVRATWRDGRAEDVTACAQFDSLNDGVAAVTPDGLVTAKNKGETHVMVRFAGQATVVQITLPYAKLDVYPQLAANNFIDEKLAANGKSWA